MEKQGGEYLFLFKFYTSLSPNSRQSAKLPHSTQQSPHFPPEIQSSILTSETVPMQQYPQSPSLTGHPQPPTYQQDPSAQYTQQQPIYPPQPQSPPPQQHAQHHGQPTPTFEEQQKAYPHPQPGMPPQQQQGGTVYQNATPIASLGRGPAPADCPACGQRSMTSVGFESGNTTHAWAAALCCFACLGCIPYAMSSTKDVTHKCGRCGVLLATWHRSGSTEVHIHS
jgi:hypothetical protein